MNNPHSRCLGGAYNKVGEAASLKLSRMLEDLLLRWRNTSFQSIRFSRRRGRCGCDHRFPNPPCGCDHRFPNPPCGKCTSVCRTPLTTQTCLTGCKHHGSRRAPRNCRYFFAFTLGNLLNSSSMDFCSFSSFLLGSPLKVSVDSPCQITSFVCESKMSTCRVPTGVRSIVVVA